VEAAAAALQDKGPDEALNRVWEGMPGADLDACLAAVQGTGHPEAADLARAVAEFAASGAPLSIEQVAELRISLSGVRPPVWRRVRLPAAATLADLHQTIQVLFGWDGDHLHLFEVGKKKYADEFTGLERTGDEQAVRIRDVLTPGAPTTSEPTGNTRSLWNIRSRASPARTTPSAWSGAATPRSSTGLRTTLKNPSRSTWPRSTGSWPRSASPRTDPAQRGASGREALPTWWIEAGTAWLSGPEPRPWPCRPAARSGRRR